MHACWILLCMLLNLLSYSSLMTKEGICKRKKSEGGLAGSVPGLWVAGYVTCKSEIYYSKACTRSGNNLTPKELSGAPKRAFSLLFSAFMCILRI
jgi:hypothetical protein